MYSLQIDLKFCVVLLLAGCFGNPCAAQTTPDASSVSSKVIATKLSGFGVPFRIDADDSSFIEVQLYLSRDAGKTWTFYGRKGIDETEFPFEAEEDGEYWFSLKTLSRDRRLLPEGDPQPELKILVDTVNPKLEVRFDADPAGRVICRWRATDQNLDPRSIKLLYQPVLSDGSVKSWQAVPVSLGGVARNGVYSDQIGWWPETTEATVNVAVEIMDSAGNSVRQARKVNLPTTAWRTRNTSTTSPNLAADANKHTTLKPTAVGAEGLPKQPDWAYPGWKSQKELQRQGKSSLPIGPQASKSSASLDKTADAGSGKPSGVVCENGVCRLASKKKTPSREKTPSRAKNVYRPPAPLAAPGSASRQVAAKRSTNYPTNRVASTNQALLPLVGSPEEFAAPPTPPGYVATQQPAAQPLVDLTWQPPTRTASAANQQVPSTINWESEKESWKPKGRLESSATTSPRKFDSTITPLPTRQTPARPPATDVPSNPGKMFFEGDKVIGQSSTMGGSNQYRGQRETVSSLSSPTLLPNASNPAAGQANQRVGSDVGLPQTGYTPFQENPAQGSIRRLPTRNFTPAGFGRGSETTATGSDDKWNAGSGSRESVMNRPTGSASNVDASSAGGSIVKPNRSTRAPVQIIGSNRFRLNYGIDSIDPSGVGKVVLWMTRDDGQTWKIWGTDPDRRSPFPVEVTEQGRYGFRIVVQSRDGLTGQGPSSGDDADIWIVVDTTAPLAQITSVPYGRGAEAGKLIINYKVADPLLTLRPITISYAANPAGPWEIIKEGARNDDRFAWKVSREVPEQIFLKIEAVDRAGNIGTHVLSQSVDVSGLVPRGTIHGVTPVGSH